MNHDHDKIKVDNRVTFEDNRDDEIQCGSREQSRTQTIWQGPKQQSFTLSARVPFAAFRSNLNSGFDCWVHSHTGCEPVTSTRGLCHGKKSEQAGCIASAQPSWLGPTYKEVSRSARVPFSTIYPFGGLSTICPFGGLSCMVRSHAVKVPITLSNELPAGLGLRSANSSSLVGRNLAFGRNLTSGRNLIGRNLAFGRDRNLAFGRYKLVELIMAFGHNELIELTLAFGRNHKELIEPNDISLSNQLIVEYSDNLLTQSCPSTFQLIVASVIWLPNATLACAKHFKNSSSKSYWISGFYCQFIVESDFEGAQCDVAPNYSICRHRRYRRHRRRCRRRSSSLSLSSLSSRAKPKLIVISVDCCGCCGQVQESKLIVVSVDHYCRRRCIQKIIVFLDSKIFFHICNGCRIFREGEWEKYARNDGLFRRLVSLNFGFVGFVGFISFVGFVGFIGFVVFVGFDGFSLIISEGTAAATKKSWNHPSYPLSTYQLNSS